MSIKVMSAVWDDSEATGNARLVLLAIADSADHDGTNAWPAIDTIAKKTRLSRSTVKRKIQELVSLAELAVVPGPSHIRSDRRPNGYEVRLPSLIMGVIGGGSERTVAEPTGVQNGPAGVQNDVYGGSPVNPNPSLPVQDSLDVSHQFEEIRRTLRRGRGNG